MGWDLGQRILSWTSHLYLTLSLSCYPPFILNYDCPVAIVFGQRVIGEDKSKYIVWLGWYSWVAAFVGMTVSRPEGLGKCHAPALVLYWCPHKETIWLSVSFVPYPIRQMTVYVLQTKSTEGNKYRNLQVVLKCLQSYENIVIKDIYPYRIWVEWHYIELRWLACMCSLNKQFV